MSCLITALMSLVCIALSFVIQQIVDIISGSTDTGAIATVVWMTVGLIVGCAVLGIGYAVFGPRFTSKAMRQYKSYAFDCMLKKSIPSFSEESMATYISALSNDATTVETNFLATIDTLVENFG